MKARIRTKTVKAAGGFTQIGDPRHRPPNPYPAYSIKIDTMQDFWKKKVDHTGRLPDSDAVLSKREVLGGWVSGTRTSLSTSQVHRIVEASSHPCPGIQIRALRSARDRGDIEYYSMLLARTNPSRTNFSIFVFIRELLEILTLFKVPMNSIGQLAGGAYLNVKFGWDQFVRDITELDGIVKSIESRFREINSIVKNGGIKRRVELDSFTVNYTENERTLYSGPGYSGKGYMSESSTTKVYGIVRWQAHPLYLDELSSLEPFEVWNKAIKLVFSLERVTPADVWNIIPFSWLVDYFYDVNTFLSATQRGDVFWPTDVSLVRRYESKAVSNVTSESNWTKMSNLTILNNGFERKILPVGQISPTFQLIPSLNQLTTISALLLRLQKRV